MNVTIPANGIPFYLQRADYFLDIQQKKVENVNPVVLKKNKKTSQKHIKNLPYLITFMNKTEPRSGC